MAVTKQKDRVHSYAELEAAVERGDAEFVADYLTQRECVLTDPWIDRGYPDEDGCNFTMVESLLYKAVPHPKVLRMLLQDGRIDLYGERNDAFYRCLNSGSIEGLQCFLDNPHFVFPKNSLIRAAQLRSKDLIEYLLSIEDKSIFSSEFDKASKIAEKHGDEEIIERIRGALQEVSLSGMGIQS